MMKILQKYTDVWSRKLSLDLKYFISGGLWLTISNLLAALGGLVLSVLFSRLWPKEVYGQFSFLMTLSSFVAITALPGMGQAVVEASAENKDGTYIVAIVRILKWSVVGTISITGLALYFLLRKNSEISLAAIIIALAFPVSSGFGIYNSFLTGKKLFKKVAIFSLVAQYVSIIATAFGLLFLPSLVIVTLLSSWSSALVSIFLTILSKSDVVNKKIDKNLLNLGVHLSFSQIPIIASSYLDGFLVPLFLGFSNNAVYSFAILIPNQIHNLFKILFNLGQPKIAETKDKNLKRALIYKSFQLELLIMLVVILYILTAPILFKILYPTYLDSAVFLSQIFALSLLYFPSNLFGLGLVKLRKKKAFYKINLSVSIMTILILIIFIPIWGLLGAIIGRILIRVIQSLLYLYYIL